MRYAMAVDLRRCMGCQTCVVSCQMNNGLGPGMARLSVDEFEWGRWPDAARAVVPHGCLHCDDPRCVRVCPTGASSREADGIVWVDADRCIGCSVCVTACPYGARSVTDDAGWFFGASVPAPYEALRSIPSGVADKCDFCRERVRAGAEPACVRDCPAGARLFGDIDDPASEISRFTAEAEDGFVGGRGFFYAPGSVSFDVGRALEDRCFKPAGAASGDRAGSNRREGNPAVVGAAVVATTAAAASLAVYKRQH